MGAELTPWKQDWTYDEETGDIEVHWTEPGPHYGIVGHADAELNGRLMAAAPDMARALLALLKWIEDVPTGGFEEERAAQVALRKAGVLP